MLSLHSPGLSLGSTYALPGLSWALPGALPMLYLCFPGLSLALPDESPWLSLDSLIT